MSDNPPHNIDNLVSAVAETLGQINVPIAKRFAADLVAIAGSSVRGTPARVPACRHLGQADLVDRAVPGAEALHATLIRADPDLCWQQSNRIAAPELYQNNHAFVELVGPDGHLEAGDIRFGLFLLGPQVFYPLHVHEAEEFYLILSGTADWQQDDDPLRPVPPGQVVHNASMQPHAMQVKSEPLFMLWGWCGDIGWSQYRFV